MFIENYYEKQRKNNSYTNNESESTSVDYNRTPEVVETFNKIWEILLLMLCRNSEIKKLLLQNLDLFSYDTKSAIDSNTSFGKLVKEVLKFSNKDIDFYECDKIHNIWKDRFKFNKTNRMQEHIIIDNKLEDTEIPEIISRISKCIVNK